MSLPSESNVESLSWPSLPSLPSVGDQETIVETILKVNKQNKIFHDKFTDVANMISNYRNGKGKFSFTNDELQKFLDNVIKKRDENSINLTMTILDLIYVNLSNGQAPYYFSENSDFLTKYDELKDIEKKYSVLVESYSDK
jgi:hypothetical protein